MKSLQQKAVLEKDVERLKGSLGEAESKLAATTNVAQHPRSEGQ